MLFSLHCVTSLLTQALLDTTRLWLPLELLMGWRIYTGAHHSQWSSTCVSLVFHVREVITLLLNVKVFQTLVAIKPDYYGGAWCFFFFLLTLIKKKMWFSLFLQLRCGGPLSLCCACCPCPIDQRYKASVLKLFAELPMLSPHFLNYLQSFPQTWSILNWSRLGGKWKTLQTEFPRASIIPHTLTYYHILFC